MDSSGGESSIGGVTAGEDLAQRSAMQKPSSLLQRMTENLNRLEIKEKEEKRMEEKRKEEKAKNEGRPNPMYEEIVKRQERSKLARAAFAVAAEMERREKKGAKRTKANADEGVSSSNAEDGVASAKAEEGMEKAKANAEEGTQITIAISEEGTGKGKASAEGITRAKAEEVTRTTDLAHGTLEMKMDSSSGESSVELKAEVEIGKVLMHATRRNLSRMELKEGEEYQQKEEEEREEYQQKEKEEILNRLHPLSHAEMTKVMERRKAQEAAMKMSKAKRAKMKAANKMKALAEKAAWAEAEELVMITKARAKEAAKIAKSKAEEAEEAATFAKLKAEEAEEAEEAV